jgi:hypothetical protein
MDAGAVRQFDLVPKELGDPGEELRISWHGRELDTLSDDTIRVSLLEWDRDTLLAKKAEDPSAMCISFPSMTGDGGGYVLDMKIA